MPASPTIHDYDNFPLASQLDVTNVDTERELLLWNIREIFDATDTP